MKKSLMMLAVGVLLLGSRLAQANPALCSLGYQDSTCVTPISRAPIAAPQCSSGAGWTTTSSPVWKGAYWSSPGCSYQPPPSCPPGYSQVTGPSWTGSNWVGLTCQPTAPPPPPPPACQYSASPPYSASMLDWGNCTADGGCDGTLLSGNYGSNTPVTQQFVSGLHSTFDSATLIQMLDSNLASVGFSRGALVSAGGGNGNSSPSYVWQICR